MTETLAQPTKYASIRSILEDNRITENATRDALIKDLLVGEIKGIDLEELVIPAQANRKWYKFGAFEMAGKLSDRVRSL